MNRDSITPEFIGTVLSRQFMEIGQEGDVSPPGLAVVNDYFVPGRDGRSVTRTSAEHNADFIAHAREDVPRLLAALAEQDILFARLANDSDACRMGAEGERAAILELLGEMRDERQAAAVLAVDDRSDTAAIAAAVAHKLAALRVGDRGPATALPTDVLLARLERYESALRDIVAEGERYEVSPARHQASAFFAKALDIVHTALQGGPDGVA